MNDKGYLIEIQYSVSEKRRDMWLQWKVPQDISLRHRDKTRTFEKESVQWVVLGTTEGQLTLNAPCAKAFMFVHAQLILNVQQQKEVITTLINYKYVKSNVPL